MDKNIIINSIYSELDTISKLIKDDTKPIIRVLNDNYKYFTYSELPKDKNIFFNNEPHPSKKPGIYIFQVCTEDIDDIKGWVDNYWEIDGLKCTPGINTIFLKDYKEKNDKLKCIYVGKSENELDKRILDHIYLEKDKTTYGLKIKERNKLKNTRFKIQWLEIDNYKDKNKTKLLLVILEYLLYDHYKPLFGSK